MNKIVYESIGMTQVIKKQISAHLRNGGRGFTLIELLVALGIGLVILGALYNLFLVQNKSLSSQELIVEMQQNARAAMTMMVSEIRMAGYDPAGSNVPGITSTSSNSISFTQDLNGNSVVSDSNENITYGYDSSNFRITRDTGGGAQPFAENIESLSLSYYDAAGSSTATLADIRKIKVEIRARTSRHDPDLSTNGGFRTYTLTSFVTPRNLVY